MYFHIVKLPNQPYILWYDYNGNTGEAQFDDYAALDKFLEENDLK